MNRFILASSNAHKAAEFNVLYEQSNIVIESAAYKLNVVEDGNTFEENAFKKAQAYFDEYKMPVMADDSGLTVNALFGELGVQSAYFGGDKFTDKERALLLLETLKNVPTAQRDAYFTCVLCFYLNEKEVYFFEGRMSGSIGEGYEGEFGFGYDPVFIPSNYGDQNNRQTLAQLPEWKNDHSHRAKACLLAKKFFSNFRNV
jgi:XTP/dITP diphosphohydrolase